MRQTAIEAVGDVPWGTHFCLFYEDRQDLIDILVPYFKAGLENNEYCLWVASPPLSAGEARAALAAGFPGLEDCVRQGRIEIVDAGGTAQWVSEKLAAAKSRGLDGLRLAGGAIRSAGADRGALAEQEAAIDSMAARHPVLAVCTRSLADCPAGEIPEWIGNHGFALFRRAGRWNVVAGAGRRESEGAPWAGEARSRRIIADQAEHIRRAASRQELLADVVGRLLASDDPLRIVDDLARRVMEELECHVFLNYLADRAQGRLRLNAHAGIGEEVAGAVEFVDFGVSVCGCAAQNRCRIVAEDIGESSDPRMRLIGSSGIKAYACHPLLAGGSVIGTLSFGSRTKTRFTAPDLGLMEAVANHMAIALERVRAQQALRESERLYRAIGESIDYGVWVCAPDGRNVYASESFLRLVGLTQEQCSEFGWGEVLHPDDSERTIAAWKECVRTAGTWDIEHRFRGADGEYHPVLARGVPVKDERGEVVCWAGINLDVSRLRLAEQRVRHQNMVLGGINRIFGEALASTAEEELGWTCLAVARSVTESRSGFIAAIDDAGLLQTIAAAPEGAWTASAGFDIQRIHAGLLAEGKGLFTNDAASRPDWLAVARDAPPCAAFLGVPLIHSGKSIGTLGLGGREGGYRPEDLEAAESLAIGVVEVLSRARAERAVRAAEERLRQAQKMESIGLLAGGIAHDFNNLLVGVIGNASLAEDLLPAASPVREILQGIVKSGEKAAHLTRQMLAYAGKGRFIVEPVDLSGIVAGAGDLVRSSLSRKVAVHFHLEPDLPAIQSDPSQMQQVFLNLALNAGEAIAGTGVVTVRTGTLEVDAARIHRELGGWPVDPGRFVFLEVSDTGCGMDEETLAKIFDPFFSTKFQGRGLGLAAVAGIVRAHKGAVHVVTAPGAGTTFRVMFPAAAASPAADGSQSGERASLRGAGTVLIIDDEQVVRDVARSALERHGYQVLTAESGAAAIEIVRVHGDRIRLAVLDLSMPGMSGEETLPRLRELKGDLDVIVSSGFSEAETLRAFHGTRVSGFIQKPYTARQLARQVKAALG